MPDIGAPELIIVLVVALIVLGPKRLPEMGQSLGRSLREFRHAISETTDAVKIGAAPTPATSPTVAPPPPPQPAPAAPVSVPAAVAAAPADAAGPSEPSGPGA
jgi:sec-independent protein translocase protein TatA